MASARATLAGLAAQLSALQLAARRLARRYLPNEAQHLLALTLAVGVICGLVAVAFHLSIQAAEHFLIDRAVRAQGSSWMFWTVLSPTLGGLLAGAALTWIVPGARGSGIPQVKQAFASEGGRTRFRDALGKFAIGAVQIGSGASLGREGPTVQICAGAASLLARATSLPPRQMRRLTPVGVAAGIAAAFNAPIAAVTFTIEEIVGTLDQSVLSGVVIAAALAAVIERGILGVHPVIEVAQAYGLDHPSSLALYAGLGIAAAIVSVAFTDGLLILRLWFRRMRWVPTWTQPAIGGLVTGVLAVLMLRLLNSSGITGGGYPTLGRALSGQLGVSVLLALCGAKLVATVFSYSSGGAGGIFAPSLFIGAMLGGAVGRLDVVLLHHAPAQMGAFALVGMGAVFAGVIRAPITSVLIIFEMTGGYGLVLPLMLANTTSYLLARHLRHMPIYESLLAQDGIVLPQSPAAVHPLEQLQVSDAMTRAVVTLAPQQTIVEARQRLGERQFRTIPVVDSEGQLVGVISSADLLQAADATSAVSSLMGKPRGIRQDEPLLRAVVRMHEEDARQLVVIEPGSRPRLAGILTMSDLLRAHARAAPALVSQPAPRSLSAELSATALMVPATEVPSATRVAELAARLDDSEIAAFVVREGSAGFGVVLPQRVLELARSEDLQKMLIAADLAHPAYAVHQGIDVLALAAALQENHAEMVVVLDPAHDQPIGVISKTALAAALWEHHASRALIGERPDARAGDADAPAVPASP